MCCLLSSLGYLSMKRRPEHYSFWFCVLLNIGKVSVMKNVASKDTAENKYWFMPYVKYITLPNQHLFSQLCPLKSHFS